MSDLNPSETDFLSQITAIAEKNISNEQFGVSELAEEMNMSRSNLLRKVKKLTKLSVSQLISQVRLKRGMEMLRKTSLNVSEISHHVGFGSTSYFIKCFREYYGYPPGEVGKREATEENFPSSVASGNKKRNLILISLAGLVILIAAAYLFYFRSFPTKSTASGKTIAVLPFKNDSNDSTNVYLVNGLMESTLNNLQKIKALNVISRTSSEKYRNSPRSIPEMARELNANYFVEGSGQKIGDRIVLNIQLIEAASDKHLWSRQYRREVKDIFALEEEVAKNIAEEVQAIITPEESRRIEKKPTDNVEAYDQFLKGRNLFYGPNGIGMTTSLPYFKKAIELDNNFALAYAAVATVYYYADIFQTEKKHLNELTFYADKAELLDSKLAESLIAKALVYLTRKEYQSALPYLEKALEYNPNSVVVINFLSEFYNIYTPNTAKYLQNALKGVKLDIAGHDSVAASYIYLHLSNAFIQTGFVDEALKYIDKSLAYYPNNPYSGYVRIFFRYAKNKDIHLTKELIVKELNKDPSRLDILEQVAKLYYVTKDYATAYRYYQRFNHLRDSLHLDIYKNENLGIGIVLKKMGFAKEAEEHIRSFKEYADSDKSIYKNLQLCMYYAYQGDASKAIEHLRLFSKEDNYQYWILLLPEDPTLEGIKNLPEFKSVMHDIETKFWDANEAIRKDLEEKGLL